MATARRTSGLPLRPSTDVKEGTAIIPEGNVLNRMTLPESTEALPSDNFPTATYLGDRKDLLLDNEGVRILHLPGGRLTG